MTVHITESVWLNASDICSFEHLTQVSGLSADALLDLIDTGILKPSNQDSANYFFPIDCIVIARTARRLRDDFDLDPQGLSLALTLMRRIDQLEAELQQLRAILPHTR